MSKLNYSMELHEIVVNVEDGEEYEETYTENLPHHDIIAKEICKSWNEAHMEQYFDGAIKDKIQSTIMRCYRDKESGRTIAKITIEGIPNYRFGSARRDMIFEQMDAQMTDGWGEGFFRVHKLNAPDGTKFYVD